MNELPFPKVCCRTQPYSLSTVIHLYEFDVRVIYASSHFVSLSSFCVMVCFLPTVVVRLPYSLDRNSENSLLYCLFRMPYSVLCACACCFHHRKWAWRRTTRGTAAWWRSRRRKRSTTRHWRTLKRWGWSGGVETRSPWLKSSLNWVISQKRLNW